MQSIFAVARQLGDEFVRVLDDLAAEEGSSSSSRGASLSQQQQQEEEEENRRRQRRPKQGPPMALVKALQSQLGIGVVALTSQNQLNILIQHFTAPMTNTATSGGGGNSLHNFTSGGGGGKSGAEDLDLTEERIFLFHLFLQLNYLHEADWVTSLAALVPNHALVTGGGGGSGSGIYGSASARKTQLMVAPPSKTNERCLKFPYVLPPQQQQPQPPATTSSSGDNSTSNTKKKTNAAAAGRRIPKELIVIKPSLAEDTMRRLYRWVAMFYMERAHLEEQLQEMQFLKLQEKHQQQKQQQNKNIKTIGGSPPAPPASAKPSGGGGGGGSQSTTPSCRWSVGCSFKGHREGAQHLVPTSTATGPVGGISGDESGATGTSGFEDTSGEDQEPRHKHHKNAIAAGASDLPSESFTLTMMGEDVPHRGLLLTQCQRHRLFRDTSPQLLWATSQQPADDDDTHIGASRMSLWDVLPGSGTRSPVVIVLQSQDLDVFGCILSAMPATRENKKEYHMGEGEMPFLSFFTFTPTFQFLDVEAPTMVPFDADEEETTMRTTPSGVSPVGGASPEQNLPTTTTSATAAAAGGDGTATQEMMSPPSDQNTATYFMSLGGEGDPPSVGRFQQQQQQQQNEKTPAASPEKKKSASSAAAAPDQSEIRREVSEVALSVDRRDEGGLTVCARFTIPGSGAQQQMMVVVLDISQNLAECRVAAKSASAELHSGFHFNIAGHNKTSTPTAPHSPTKASIDDLAILEDDRRTVPLRAVEVYHMETVPSLHHHEASPHNLHPAAATAASSPPSSTTEYSSQVQQQQKQQEQMRRAYSEAPPFVIHPESPDEKRNKVEDDDDDWESAELVASPNPPRPHHGQQRTESTDDFVVVD